MGGSMAERRWRVMTLAGIAAVVLAACNNNSSTTPPAGGGSRSQAAGDIGVTSVGSLGKVLTGPNGLTLYHNTRETAGTFVCTGSCASIWPPLLATSGAAPAAMANLPHTIGTVKRPDGTVQVTYDGFPLY